MSRWVLWVPLALFGLFFVIMASGIIKPGDRTIESRMVGKPLPAFALPAAVPERPGLASAQFSQGEPRLLNIFASWCIPCRVEAPQLEALRQNGVEIVAVAIRDRPEDLAGFFQVYGNPFTRVGADDIAEVQLSIGSSGVPETFVIDGQGVIRYQHLGEIRPEHVPMLMARLQEAGAS